MPPILVADANEGQNAVKSYDETHYPPLSY